MKNNVILNPYDILLIRIYYIKFLSGRSNSSGGRNPHTPYWSIAQENPSNGLKTLYLKKYWLFDLKRESNHPRVVRFPEIQLQYHTTIYKCIEYVMTSLIFVL